MRPRAYGIESGLRVLPEATSGRLVDKKKTGGFSSVGLHKELVEAQYAGPDLGLADLDLELKFLAGVGKSAVVVGRMPGRRAFVFVFDFF